MDYRLTPTSLEGFIIKLITDLTTKEDDFLPHGRNRILPIDCHYKVNCLAGFEPARGHMTSPYHRTSSDPIPLWYKQIGEQVWI